MTRFNQYIIDKVFLVFTMLFAAFCLGLSISVFSLYYGYTMFVGLIGIPASVYLWIISFNYYLEIYHGKD